MSNQEPAADQKPPFEKMGKYKILSEIGQGAMGVVYKAHDPILNREVAIKMISASLGADDELRKRFHREAQAAARLNHPNIITVFDFGEEQGKIYMAMELLEGTDLKDIMAAGSLTGLDDKMAVMEQILDGLAFAHGKEIVHRDLKPGNIHIQPNGQIKIMDFGLARLGSSEMTQAGVVMGTPNYMSPEQVLGEKVDSRSDIFAMGAVFYELLSGHKPFEAESMHGVLFQVVHKEAQNIRKWAPDLPPVLVQIVEKCLIKDKGKRFQNAGELRDAVGIARQALAAGRINEATLDMESGKVFFDAEEYVDETGRRFQGSEAWVEGTVALDQAPLEAVLDEPSGKSHPTLSGRNRTQTGRMGGSQPSVIVQAPSRAPLIIGGAVVVVGLIIAGVLLLKPSGPARPSMDPTFNLLLDSQLRLARRDLDDKKYKDAISGAESTIAIAENNPSAENPMAQKSLSEVRKVLNDARGKLTQIENAASEAEDAFNSGDMEKSSVALSRLFELDPKHPVATNLSTKLSTQFRSRAEDARRAMAQAKTEAEKLEAQSSEDYGRGSTLARDSEAALAKNDYAVATRGFLEARDSFDRARRAIEAKRIEEARSAEEKARLQQAEEARRQAEAARQAEATRKAEEARKAEDARKAEEQRKADEAKRVAANQTLPTPPPAPVATPPPVVTPTAAPLPPPIGRIEFAPSAMGKGGFLDVATEFKAKMEFESDKDVRPGQPYAIKVYLTNTGDKGAKIKEVSINTRLNAAGTPKKVSPLTKNVEPGARALVAEVTGTWPDAIRSWVTIVSVYADKEEYCEGKVSFRK